MTSESLGRVAGIYRGSNGEATRALYAELQQLGPVGIIGLNLFRAQKCSARAKAYRGSGYKADAYARKQWSMDNLAQAMLDHSAAVPWPWGWQLDPDQPFHNQVLYIEIPTGQVSFHTDRRGLGPDYPGTWDGMRDVAAGRIISWVAQLLDGKYIA